MFGRKRNATTEWLETKFAKRPELAAANVAVERRPRGGRDI